MRTFACISNLARASSCFVRQLWLLLVEVPMVWFFMARLKAGRLPHGHPWETGSATAGQACIWTRNIVYASPHRRPENSQESDEEIVSKTGQFLARMVARSAADIPLGPKRRMPHAVNYIHGAVHYNGLFLLFDDFADLRKHLSGRQFRRELLRVGRTERRELTLLFRQRDYDPLDFAYCVGNVRNNLPWFSNGNGPTKRPVLWGNMAPYPAINLINGAWADDLLKLLRGELQALVRPPVERQHYFNREYRGTNAPFSWLDRLQAWYMYTDVRLRGFRGQLFFVNRRQIEPQRIAEYEQAGGYGRWVACHKVPFPRRLKRGVSK